MRWRASPPPPQPRRPASPTPSPAARIGAALLGTAALLAACERGPRTAPGDDPAATPAAVASAPAQRHAAGAAASAAFAYTATVVGRLQADGPELKVLLHADAPPGETGVLRVRAIDIVRSGAAQPLQRIGDLDTRTPWTVDAPGAEFLDMNFDGYVDLRLIEFAPAGPNVPYRNWLYEPARGRFAASPDLDELSAPTFDAVQRVVRSTWRDSAARYGTDTLAWVDGRLVPRQRTEREVKRPGVFVERNLGWSDGRWVLRSTRESRGN